MGDLALFQPSHFFPSRILKCVDTNAVIGRTYPPGPLHAPSRQKRLCHISLSDGKNNASVEGTNATHKNMKHTKFQLRAFCSYLHTRTWTHIKIYIYRHRHRYEPHAQTKPATPTEKLQTINFTQQRTTRSFSEEEEQVGPPQKNALKQVTRTVILNGSLGLPQTPWLARDGLPNRSIGSRRRPPSLIVSSSSLP